MKYTRKVMDLLGWAEIKIRSYWYARFPCETTCSSCDTSLSDTSLPISWCSFPFAGLGCRYFDSLWKNQANTRSILLNVVRRRFDRSALYYNWTVVISSVLTALNDLKLIEFLNILATLVNTQLREASQLSSHLRFVYCEPFVLYFQMHRSALCNFLNRTWLLMWWKREAEQRLSSSVKTFLLCLKMVISPTYI